LPSLAQTSKKTIMRNIASLPLALQSLFAELKAEQDAEQAIDGTQTQASKEDILDEVVLLKTDVDVDPVDEDDEEQIDMSAVSPAMRAVFN
tara:strand:+ start:131 stop:403 length:273 start_codon:yes stop_codon:yes gene_type:complete